MNDLIKLKNLRQNLQFYFSGSERIADRESQYIWENLEERARWLTLVVEDILQQPLSDNSIRELEATKNIFLAHRKSADMKSCAFLMYAIGNILFLGIYIGIPISEWSALAVQGRELILKLAKDKSPESHQQELTSFLEKIYNKKEEFRKDPRFTSLIETHDNMGG